MADTTSRAGKRHTRRQESISKCRSLPSLQLTPSDGSADFVCSKCGLTSSLIPICLRCYQTSNLDEDQRPLNKRVSWSIISAVTTQEGPYGQTITEEIPPTLSPPSIASQKTSEASCQPQIQEVTRQINKGSSAHGQGLQQPDGVVVTSGRLNTDLHNDRIETKAPSAPLSPPTRPTLEKLLKTKLSSHIRQFQRDDDASGPPHCEDNRSSSPVAMSHSTASCVSSVQVSAHSAVSSNNSGAGSSYASPHSTSSSSSSRRLRSRSKSLFSLSIASAVGPSSSTNSDTNTRTIINNNQPTSTTTNMINAAKALTRRISSTTLRVMESSTLSTHVTTIPELKQHDLAPISGQVLSDEKLARFDCEDRTLRRKKRLGVAASPTSRPPPVASINSSTLKKQVSVASLKASKPISVSFKLSKRPGTSESEGSAAGDNMGDNVKTNTHDSVFPSSAASPKELAHPDAHIDTRARYPGETADTSSQQIMQPPPLDTDVDRPQQSPTHGSSTGSLTRPSSQTVTPVSVVPAQPNPRIGHPSRPYYSAIRKHHMSAPAPPKLVSPPQSVEVSPANSRPVSTSAHHPPSAFAMQMSAIAPFARRPVSLGAVPSGASSSHVAHGHTNSVGSTTTKGMSVFDLEDENYVDVVDDEEASNSTAPSSYKAKQGKKSHSLSKAFVRGHKRRTWSYGLFSGEEEVARSANFAAKSANHGRRLSHGVPPPPPLSLDRIGVSMSGETELRMTLAMLEQQERAQQQQEAEVEGLSTSPLPSGSLKVLAVPTQSERFRFRHTADFSQQQHTVDGQPTLNENAGPSRTGTPSGSGSAGVMARVRKFKKSFIKGLQVLGSTSATHPAS